MDLARRELRTNGVAVPLGTRAFDIVEVLVQSAGELVTKDEIMRRVWSGAIVEESTLQVHISAIRKALGADRGLLKTVFGRGYRLLGHWPLTQRAVPPDPVVLHIVPAPAAPSSNLPLPTSELIGRETAAQHLLALLSAYRVVTLTGPGGIGKSALALDVARQFLPGEAGDGWLVELAPLSDPRLVPSTAAGVLGLKLGEDAISDEAVARAIGAKHVLLVLDNCEHVVDAAATFAETVMRLCPRTTVLATSREAFRIEGEHVYRVPALEVPPEDREDPSDILRHSAVALFIARTQALDSDFSTNGDDLSAIAAICRHLDGIPLAIEFAAARSAVLGARQIASRLDDRFALLTSGRRNALSRHRTLRAALDWSYDLLPDPEKCLLRRLAVFAGGFTIEAATAVMDGGDNGEAPIMEGIARLLEKSLITRDESIAGRWRLLETIRAYASEKLVAGDGAERTARRHAEFFRDLFAAPAPEAQVKSGIRDITHWVRELDNVRAALDWAFSPLGDPVLGIVLTAAYAPVWMQLSLVVECRERIGRALDSLELQSDLDARLTMRVCVELAAADVYGSGEKARNILGKALEVAERLDDKVSQLRAIWAIWSDRNLCGDYRSAQLYAERFSTVARRVGDPADILVGDRLVGTTMHYRGNQAQARRYLERVLALYVAPSDQRHTIWFYHNQRSLARLMLARVLCVQGFLEQATHQAQSSLEDAQATDHALSLRYVLGWAVFPIALMTKDFAAAESSVATFIDLSATHLPYWEVLGRSLQGTLLIKRGEFAAGSALLGAALDTCVRPGWRMRFPDFLGILAEGLAGLGRLAEAHVTIEEAIERSSRDGERWCLAELLRIKGELLLEEATAQPSSAAEDCFVGAIDLAREQGALFWELRSALSLARLRASRGRADEARQVLAPVYDRFTEGFETPDLKAAKAFLDALE